MMTYPSVFKLSLLALPILLSGCNGGDSGSDDNAISVPVLAPLANNTFAQLSQQDNQTLVSLSQAVIDPQGLPVTLESVMAETPGCPSVVDMDSQALTFTVTNDKLAMCTYRYVVSNHPVNAAAQSSSAQSIVLTTLTSEPARLSPLSEMANVGDVVTINVTDDLDATEIDGFTLDASVLVLGDGSASGDSATGVITYNADTEGVTRLVYTLTNADATEMLVGTVDVAVSADGNHPPVAPDIPLPADGSYYQTGVDYPIDLTSYVSDEDGDALELVEVLTWDATATLSDTESLSFTFSASESGTHYASYVVSDQRGGYGVGQMAIEVLGESDIHPWTNIQHGMSLFFAPLTSYGADAAGVAYTDHHDESSGHSVATFSFAQAETLCATKGRLPSIEELTELTALNPVTTANWPVEVEYFADDGSVMNLSSGVNAAADDASSYYVTCVNEAGFAIDPETTVTQAVADGVDTATVSVALTWDGEPVVGEIMTATLNSEASAILNTSSETTGADGHAQFTLTNTVAETVTVGVESHGAVLTQEVTFNGDETTAALGLAVTKDSAYIISDDFNEVQAAMTDGFDNPIEGLTVSFSAEPAEDVRIESDAATDEAGHQSAQVYFEGEMVGGTDIETVTVTANYTRSDATPLEATQSVTFLSGLPLCGGIVDDASQTNVNGLCLKVASDSAGSWFTGAPSVALVEALGYKRDDTRSNSGDTFATRKQELGLYGATGSFATFRQDGDGVAGPSSGASAGVDGQFDRWCQKLASLNFAGKSDWRRPSIAELESLRATYSDYEDGLWDARGWAIGERYWSDELDGSGGMFRTKYLYSDFVSAAGDSYGEYASCVSPVPLAEATIDMTYVATGEDTGKVFTSSPSVAFLDAMGGGDLGDKVYTETGSTGPAGDFYMFYWNNANALCELYNTQALDGRTNWRLPSAEELLDELYGAYGNMFARRGWPSYDRYWTSTSSGADYYGVNVNYGASGVNSPTAHSIYASCVSED